MSWIKREKADMTIMSEKLSSAESTESILVRKENGVQWITLNRPSVLNALNHDLLKLLQDAVIDAENDPKIRCVVLAGAGKAFCAGADLQAMGERQRQNGIAFTEHLKQVTNPIISKIRNMDKPVVSMINGVAAGAGMSLALSADIKIIAEGAKFVEAFAKIGLVPDAGATFFMARYFGLSKAMELAFTGEAIDAKEAQRLGAVNRVVPISQLEIETRALAEKLATGPKAIGLAKHAINKALYVDLDEALDYEAYLQQTAGSSEDFKEGVRAFIEKRSPHFQGI
jgi:2-(1,2-epoxy-1,2-dihydrophenyl)acetyl-CoA isomerase